MDRKFNIGDWVICKSSGVIGRVIRFYLPTACAEQTMVDTTDGRKYHAPTSEWVRILDGKVLEELVQERLQRGMINKYGECVSKFVENHRISISEAYEQPMVKARYDFSAKQGCRGLKVMEGWNMKNE